MFIFSKNSSDKSIVNPPSEHLQPLPSSFQKSSIQRMEQNAKSREVSKGCWESIKDCIKMLFDKLVCILTCGSCNKQEAPQPEKKPKPKPKPDEGKRALIEKESNVGNPLSKELLAASNAFGNDRKFHLSKVAEMLMNKADVNFSFMANGKRMTVLQFVVNHYHIEGWKEIMTHFIPFYKILKQDLDQAYALALKNGIEFKTDPNAKESFFEAARKLIAKGADSKVAGDALIKEARKIGYNPAIKEESKEQQIEFVDVPESPFFQVD